MLSQSLYSAGTLQQLGHVFGSSRTLIRVDLSAMFHGTMGYNPHGCRSKSWFWTEHSWLMDNGPIATSQSKCHWVEGNLRENWLHRLCEQCPDHSWSLAERIWFKHKLGTPRAAKTRWFNLGPTWPAQLRVAWTVQTIPNPLVSALIIWEPKLIN